MNGNDITEISAEFRAAVAEGLNDEAGREAARQEALIGPLRNVYGVSDKILMMTLSTSLALVA